MGKMEKIFEPFIRGAIGEFLDKAIKEDKLKIYFLLARGLKPEIRSEEDAILGFIIGECFGRLMASMITIMRRELSDKELEIYFNEIKIRIPKIRSKIRDFANL